VFGGQQIVDKSESLADIATEFNFDGQLLSGSISSGTARKLVRCGRVVTNSN
jgi:hypothetical protein